LISGGTGLIGRALAASLVGDQHEVIVLSRNPERVFSMPPSVRVERWDARTPEGWAPLADGADAIVNLAGESIGGESTRRILFGRWTPARKRRILESRTHAGEAMTLAVEMAHHKPHSFIQASAVGYYGVRRSAALGEEDGPGDDFLSQVCVAWENTTARLEAMGVRRSLIRTGVVLSTTGGVLPLILLPFRLFLGGRLSRGDQWFPWIHLTDEVAALRFLIDSPAASGPFNLTAPNPVANREMARVIARVMHRPGRLPAPGIALRMMLGDKATLVLDGQRPLPRRLLSLGFTFRFPELDAALRDLLA
jgi:uncharacterized protein (TIGR01777 family)